jgi:hypothetical protein
MKKISLVFLCIAISLSVFTASMAFAANFVGKWELVRVETAAGKIKPLPPKPKKGEVEFFKDKTVLFSDGLKGEWSISEDGGLKIILMEVLEVNGELQGDLLRLSNMVNPDEILVLKKQE